MRKMTKFKDLPKNQKVFRIVNLCFMSAIALAALGLVIYYAVIGDPDRRLSISGITIGIALAPFLLEIIFRFRFNPIIFLAYQIYFLVASLIGAACNVYNMVWWFDTPVHIIMGYLVAMCGIFIIARLGEYKKFNPWLVIVFCLMFSLSVEFIWELSEFTVDRLFGTNAQKGPELWDTLKDMFCNFGGAIVFFLHYTLGKFTKLNLAIPAIEKTLSTRANQLETPQPVEAPQEENIEEKIEE